jgi:hypothetical protein
MGAYILHFADAIIAAAKRKADIFINFMLRHAPSQTTPTLKNPRNPENPDSKPSYRINPDYPKV